MKKIIASICSILFLVSILNSCSTSDSTSSYDDTPEKAGEFNNNPVEMNSGSSTEYSDSFSSNENSKQENEFSLSSFLNKSNTYVLYDNFSGTPGKDVAPDGFYIIKDNRISYYYGTHEMNKANLLAEQKRDAFSNTKIFSDENEKANEEYEEANKNYERLLEEYQAKFSYSNLTKMSDEELIKLIKNSLDCEYENESYDIALFTDSSGNNVASEQLSTNGHKLIHSYDAMSGQNSSDINKPQEKKDELYFNPKKLESGFDSAEVYESFYYKLFSNTWIRLKDEQRNCVITYDDVNSKNVVVDPYKKETNFFTL